MKDADELTLAALDARHLLIGEYMSMLDLACPRDDMGVPRRAEIDDEYLVLAEQYEAVLRRLDSALDAAAGSNAASPTVEASDK